MKANSHRGVRRSKDKEKLRRKKQILQKKLRLMRDPRTVLSEISHQLSLPRRLRIPRLSNRVAVEFQERVERINYPNRYIRSNKRSQHWTTMKAKAHNQQKRKDRSFWNNLDLYLPAMVALLNNQIQRRLKRAKAKSILIWWKN